MDKWSQRNCRMKGLTLLKVRGRRLLSKRWGDVRWKEEKTYLNAYDCYKGALELARSNTKYVKL